MVYSLLDLISKILQLLQDKIDVKSRFVVQVSNKSVSFYLLKK